MFLPEIVFSNNMVLQRNKPIRIFGECENETHLIVTLQRGEDSICANASIVSNRFEAVLPPQIETGREETVTLSISNGVNTITYSDVAIGEVWLAGGQSNMELELQNALDGREILETPLSEEDERTLIRYYYTPKVSYRGDTYESIMRNTGWSRYYKESASAWSAVAFYFARNLAKELGITIGVIGCNWGGTSASCWMSREALLSRETTKSYVEEYEQSEHVSKPVSVQIKEYEDYLEYHTQWDQDSAKLYREVPGITWDEVQERLGPCQYPGPMNCANFTRPYGLYDTMVKRLIPYTLGGVIYYQGESDDHKPDSYYDLQSLLIEQWRKDFKNPELPFIMTQLPMHRYEADPDTKSWCRIREAQMRVFQNTKNTGLAVIIDQGKFNEIHPPRKEEVGRRLALQALWMVYHIISERDCFGPVYKDMMLQDGDLKISFDYAENGFTIYKPIDEDRADLELGFEIAGEDGYFYPAEAYFEKNEVILSCEKVRKPLYARYLWSNYAQVYVFGKNNLPMAPFFERR